MSFANLALSAAAEGAVEESTVVYPTWTYGAATLTIMLLLVYLVTRLNMDR